MIQGGVGWEAVPLNSGLLASPPYPVPPGFPLSRWMPAHTPGQTYTEASALLVGAVVTGSLLVAGGSSLSAGGLGKFSTVKGGGGLGSGSGCSLDRG